MSFSSSCIWASMFRRWPSSRAWTPASYWACSAAAAKWTHIHMVSPSYSQIGLAGLPGQSPMPDTSKYPIFTTRSTCSCFLFDLQFYFSPCLNQSQRLGFIPQSLFLHILVKSTGATCYHDKAQFLATLQLNFLY